MPIPDSPDPNTSILIVDDDAALRDMVADYLHRQGYQISVANSAHQMEVELRRHPIDVILLDIVLPDEDGLSICRRMNAHIAHNAPAIVIMSGRSEEADRVIGLEFGADDYVCKPFSARELLARIRAVLRRRRPSSSGKHSSHAASFLGLAFNPRERRIVCQSSGDTIDLTPQETVLLQKFIAAPRCALSRHELMDTADFFDSAADARAVDVRISRLRRKLQPYCGGNILRAARGSGYVFDADIVNP